MTVKQILRTAQAFHRTFRIPANDSSQMLPVPIPPAPDAEAEPTSEPEAADDTSNTENTDNTVVSFAADNVPK